jgi:O-antigen ligase
VSHATAADREAARPPASSRPVGALRAARLLLWLAVLLPFVYTTAKNASDLSSGGIVGPLEMLRGGGPVLLWGVSILLAPTVRRGFGLPEVAVAAYGAIILASYLNPSNPNPQASLLKSMSLIFALVAMARLVRLYQEPTELVTALSGFVHAILLGGAIQLFLFRSTVYQVGPTAFDTLPRLNLVVPSVSANPLAMLGVAGILSCALGVAPRWMRFNLAVRNALMLLYAYEVYLTRTRSALLVGVLIILASLVLRARRHPLSSIVTGLVAAVGVVLVTPSGMGDLHSFLQRGQTAHGIDTLSGRTVIWSQAHQVWLQHQWLGLGYFTGHRLGIPGLSQTQSNIDNTWLETLVDVGIVGTIALSIYVLSGVWRLVRSKELDGDVRLWAIGVSLYIVGISFINPTVQQPEAAGVVLGLLLLSVGPRERRGGPAAPEVAGSSAQRRFGDLQPSRTRWR